MDSHLTDAERDVVVDAFDHETSAHCWRDHCDDGLWPAVETLIAARVAAERERIAQAIEADRDRDGRVNALIHTGMTKAARIARADRGDEGVAP